MSQLAQRTAPSPHPYAPPHGGRDHLRRPANEVWSEHPVLVGVQSVIDFADDELGVRLTPSIVRHATEERRIRVFKVSARNAYSPADVVRFVQSLARPAIGGAA